MSREEGRRHCYFMDSKARPVRVLLCGSCCLQGTTATLCAAAGAALNQHGLFLAPGRPPCRRNLSAPAGCPLSTHDMAFTALLQGLVCASRTDLQHHKRPFAHDVALCRTLQEAIQALRPTVLIGVSTIAGAFSRDVLQVGGA